MKFYILERGHLHTENTLHTFDTAEARAAKTAELIYGEKPDELDPDARRAWHLYCAELEETGSVEFEGDPGLEWFTASPAT